MSTADSQTTFLYAAMNDVGKKQYGFKTAGDEAQLSEMLATKKLYMVSATRIPFTTSAAASVDESKRIPLKDEVAINEQLRLLIDRGVPLVEVLDVAASVVSPKTRARVLKLRELVAAGTSFADACEQVGGFDTVASAVYRAAERTGDLGDAAGRLAVAARRRLAMTGKAITVMIYPSVIVTIATLIVFGLLAFLVPNIADQVEGLGADPPGFSKFVFATGRFLNANLIASVVVIAGGLAIAVLLRDGVLRVLGGFGRRIGAVGMLLRSIELTRLFAVLGAMTRSGVPLAEALSFSTAVIGDPELRGQLERLQTKLVEGGVLRSLLEEVTTLPLATRRLLIAAERGGDIDSAFDTLSEDMANDVDQRAARLLALLEPLIIVGMFAVLGPLVIAIAIPMMTLNTSGVG